MAKKLDNFYFDNFIESAKCSSQAAKLLKEFLNNYDEHNLRAEMDKMHEIEHSADIKKHELTENLVKAFITPIDREDIIEMSHNLDDLTDKIEDVLVRLYLNHVSSINPHALKMVEIVEKCCDEILALMTEFKDFKRSKQIKDHIIKINSLEEQGDRLYISSMYSLKSESQDALYVMAWRDIYTYLEKCADTAEHIADNVELVIMKNS